MVLYVKNHQAYFDEALVDYVRKGSITVLQSFLQKDNSHTTDFSGSTLLHYAAESNNVSMTQFFISNKYNVDDRDYCGNTPLMLAVKSGSIDTAKLLLKADADIYFRNSRGKTILPDRSEFKVMSRALFDEYDDSKVLKKYRELTKSILEKVRKDCWNDEQLLLSKLSDIDCSLINVICLRDTKITRLMLENGYSVNERDIETQETALHEAVKLGDYQNVKVLLEFGADVHALNKGGLSAIYSYLGDSSKDIGERIPMLKILIERGALLTRPLERNPPSQFILSTGKLWALKTLMQYDFEWDPFYSLHSLVSNKDPDALEAVRDKNLDLNSVHNPPKSPVLSLASMLGHFKKVQFLLESGANPNIVGKGGHTPFTSSFRYLFKQEKQHLPIIRLMLQYGADTQYSTEAGRTVFDEAISYHHESLLEPVIAHLAMIESLGQTITNLIRTKIKSQDSFKTQFEICQLQLADMKSTIIYERVTLYKLLTESQTKINRYARNREFVGKFKQKMKIEQRSLDPYYSLYLRKRVGKAIKVAAIRREAVMALNKIVESRVKNYYDILTEIVDYLNCDDMNNICKVCDLEELESFNLDTLFGVGF